jgi:hypothetical protein
MLWTTVMQPVPTSLGIQVLGCGAALVFCIHTLLMRAGPKATKFRGR